MLFSIQNPNISWYFLRAAWQSLQKKILINFLVSWHKQGLEPSLIYPSGDRRSELDQRWLSYYLVTKHTQEGFPYQQQKRGTGVGISFFKPFLGNVCAADHLLWIWVFLSISQSAQAGHGWSLEGEGVSKALPALISTIWATVSSSAAMMLISSPSSVLVYWRRSNKEAKGVWVQTGQNHQKALDLSF